MDRKIVLRRIKTKPIVVKASVTFICVSLCSWSSVDDDDTSVRSTTEIISNVRSGRSTCSTLSLGTKSKLGHQ